MTTVQYEQNCSIMRFVVIFSGKWVLPIVYHLIHAQHPVRFNQLQKALAPIPQKELSKQLKLLEECQLISKQIYPEIPPRVEYQITALGKSLESSIRALGDWMMFYEKNRDEK
ncbi:MULTISPECIES: helix-turn-helix domain-containing protein [unclassified Acinetobacter]|uniref:winged helix-turn-helix transcriptional regulator n=1 Tax=unclassified Acinetobacter TaxID=196816 RepID=UPI0018A8D457|nr:MULTISPECIES: helix-turn-helix domain-containing protein [unclassified Acinetobacter]MBJ9952358.1 helix-turn-helix transcriptional regulator [Acinetobacter baumannii]